MTYLNKKVEKECEDFEKTKKELNACQHLLVHAEIEKWEIEVFKLQITQLNTKVINEKHEEVFNKLDSAAKINIALVFFLKNFETGEYQFFYAHGNKFFLKNSKCFVLKRI